MSKLQYIYIKTETRHPGTETGFDSRVSWGAAGVGQHLGAGFAAITGSPEQDALRLGLGLGDNRIRMDTSIVEIHRHLLGNLIRPALNLRVCIPKRPESIALPSPATLSALSRDNGVNLPLKRTTLKAGVHPSRIRRKRQSGNCRVSRTRHAPKPCRCQT